MRSFTNNHPPPKLERVFHSELPIIQLKNSILPLCQENDGVSRDRFGTKAAANLKSP